MQINSDFLSVGKIPIAAAASIFATTLLWAFFLGMTGLGANDLFTFKLHIVLGKVLTTNMLLFFLTFPLPIAIMAAFAKRTEKLTLMVFAVIPSLLALIIAMAAFQQLQSLWIIAVFYLAAVPLAIENATVKYLELKKRATARTMWSATGRATTLISIGLIVLSISTIVPDHEQYLERFDEFFMDFAYGISSGQNQETISSGATDIFIVAQVETLNMIIEQPSFEKLREKTDPDVIEFVARAEIAADYVSSPEYRQEMEESFREGTSSIVKEIDMMQMIKEYFPFILLLESIMPLGIWIGLMHAITLAGLFSFASLVLSKTTAVAYGLAADKVLSKTGKPGQEQEPGQDPETGQELEIEQDF